MGKIDKHKVRQNGAMVAIGKQFAESSAQGGAVKQLQAL